MVYHTNGVTCTLLTSKILCCTFVIIHFPLVHSPMPYTELNGYNPTRVLRNHYSKAVPCRMNSFSVYLLITP